MNLAYLDSLPEVANKYNVELEDGEKVVFNAMMSVFGDEKDVPLGGKSKFTLTNRHIITNNGPGIWTINIAEDIINCFRKGNKALRFFNLDCIAVELNREIIYEDGRGKLTGFHFYFKRSVKKKLEKIMENVFNNQ